MSNFKNKKITVVGLARSGLAAAEFLKGSGAEVKVTEIKKDVAVEAEINRIKNSGIKIELGSHSRNFVEGADLIVVSPGISSDSLPIIWAKEIGIPVIGELELASQSVTCPIIAVTGTNGKTTTTTLLGEMLKKRHKVEMAGNIGRPLSRIVSNLTKEHLLILEVSSFQLERIKDFHPRISIILNITPDHLDRYQGFEDYLSAKKRIFLNQKPGDYAVFPADMPYTKSLMEGANCSHILFGTKPGKKRDIFYKDSSIWSNLNGREEKILDEGILKLKGPHNRENIMAALAVALILGEDIEEIKEVLKNFSGLEHRLEIVSRIEGVTFVNDSKSTNVDSLIKAIQSFPNVILIAGGRDKGADFFSVREDIKKKVKEIILLGEAKGLLKDAWQGTKPIHMVKDLEEAVIKAQNISKSGDVVLFSPGCSSFDMFKNFEERGKVFKDIVLRFSRAIDI